jgi:hypothetical protein
VQESRQLSAVDRILAKAYDGSNPQELNFDMRKSANPCRRLSQTDLMSCVHGRIFELLRESAWVSNEDLIEIVMGRTSGGRELAGKIINQYLEGHPGLFKNINGGWQLSEPSMEQPDIQLTEAIGLCLLLIDRLGEADAFALGMALQTCNGAFDWLVLKSGRLHGRLVFHVLSGKDDSGDEILDAERAGLLVDRAAKGASLWYLGRAADLRRFRRLFRPNIPDEPTPLWPVARRMLKLPAAIRPEALARALDLPEYDESPNMPAIRLRWWADALQRVITTLSEEGIQGKEAIANWLAQDSIPAIDFGRFGFSRSDLWAVPESPGVYCFRDRSETLLYVGKTKNLRRRILSYFQPGSASRARKRFLIAKIHTFEYHSLGSDLEALVRENRLIQNLEPVFNVQQSVRSPQTGYFAHSPAVAVFPSPDHENVLNLWCLRPGRQARQITFNTSTEGIRRARKALIRIFMKPGCRGKAQWNGESLLVAAWLHRNRNSANWIDVDKAADIDELIRQLCMYASAAGELEDQRIIFR